MLDSDDEANDAAFFAAEHMAQISKNTAVEASMMGNLPTKLKKEAMKVPIAIASSSDDQGIESDSGSHSPLRSIFSNRKDRLEQGIIREVQIDDENLYGLINLNLPVTPVILKKADIHITSSVEYRMGRRHEESDNDNRPAGILGLI